MMDAIERYIRGEMLPEERAFFEELRKGNPAVDQMVVEHTLFLEQMATYGEQKDFTAQLSEIHKGLIRDGEIKEAQPAKVIFLWRKYKRVVWVAASIAGITALFISGLVSYVSPKVDDGSIQKLSRGLNQRINDQDKKINYYLNNHFNQGSSLPDESRFTSGGTGFLIDPKGYLVTNAHVVKNATLVEVQNNKGEYSARIIHLDPVADLAFLKIEDSSFKPSATLPYSISKGVTDLAEEIFTLGYPRDEIVYGQGYMSAKTGYEGDTLACQIAVAANPGNSGGPILNKNGEVIGVLSTRESKAQGVVFAIRAKNIFRAVEEMKADSALLKTDSTLSHLRLPVSSSIRGMERAQQVKKIEDCIFIVKSNLSN